MNKTNTLSIAIVSLLLLLVVIQQSVPVAAEVNLPYKEGDWFKYRMEFKAGDQQCWFEYEIKVLNIDVDARSVDAEVKILKSGGNSPICVQSRPPIETGTRTFSLRQGYESVNALIDPSVSGRFTLSNGAVVVYDKGVLRELVFTQTYMGVKYEMTIRLIDSSVMAYKPWLSWLIIIAVIVVIVVVVVLVVRRLRRKLQTLTTEQHSPGLQPPQSPQPTTI